MSSWTPAEISDLAATLVQLVVAITALVAIFMTRGDVKRVGKDVDGRFSQLLEVIKTLSGPDRRAPVSGERRGGTDGKAH